MTFEDYIPLYTACSRLIQKIKNILNTLVLNSRFLRLHDIIFQYKIAVIIGGNHSMGYRVIIAMTKKHQEYEALKPSAHSWLILFMSTYF